MEKSGSHIPLSIAIPTYNRRDAVLALIKAVQAQVKDQDAIIIADDGSTDGTPEEVSKVSRVRLIRQNKNQGMVANWNICLNTATRDWICVVHDDDVLEPNGLNVLRRACAVADEPALIVPTTKQTECDDAFRFSYWSPGSWAVLHCPGIPSGAIVHRDIVKHLGVFNTKFRYSPDIEYFSRIIARYPLIIVESPLAVRYNLHDSNYQVRTWKEADFIQQLEEIQHLIVSYANLQGISAELLVQHRLTDNFEYILKEAYRRNDINLIQQYKTLLDGRRHPVAGASVLDLAHVLKKIIRACGFRW